MRDPIPFPFDDAPEFQAMFHTADGGGFPLAGCSYQLYDRSGAPTGRLQDATCLRVITASGERFRLRHADIGHFLDRIGWPGGGL